MGEALAVVLALVAALLFGSGNALEHRVVAELPSQSGRSVVGRVLRSPMWWLGAGGDFAAFGFQAGALAFGPLTLVQPILVCGVLFALPLSAHWAGRRLVPYELLAAIALCVALATFLIVAAPSGGDATAPVSSWIAVGGVMVGIAGAALVLAIVLRDHVRAALLGLAAGVLFGVATGLTKTSVEQLRQGLPYLFEHWEVYGMAVFSLLGTFLAQSGFRSALLRASLPATEVAAPIVAVLLATTVLHERINGAGAIQNALIGFSCAAMIVSIVVLARSAGASADSASLGAQDVGGLESRDAAAR